MYSTLEKKYTNRYQFRSSWPCSYWRRSFFWTTGPCGCYKYQGYFWMKKKAVYLIVSILLVLAFLALLAVIDLGKTLRVAKANRRLAQADDAERGVAAAQRVYEDLLVDQPHSPYLLHNLGLTLYRGGRRQRLPAVLTPPGKGLAKMTGERRVNPENRRRLEHIFHYHRGSAWFTTAGKGALEEAIAGYEKSPGGI